MLNLGLESNEVSMERYVENKEASSSYSKKESDETEVSCVIDFYDKDHFNKMLAYKMKNFLNKSRRKRI